MKKSRDLAKIAKEIFSNTEGLASDILTINTYENITDEMKNYLIDLIQEHMKFLLDRMIEIKEYKKGEED